MLKPLRPEPPELLVYNRVDLQRIGIYDNVVLAEVVMAEDIISLSDIVPRSPTAVDFPPATRYSQVQAY